MISFYRDKTKYLIKKGKFSTVTIVKNNEQAKEVIEILKNHKDRIHAWTIKTTGIDLKNPNPILSGKIIGLSCFLGPDIDFGSGPSNIYFFKFLSRKK